MTSEVRRKGKSDAHAEGSAHTSLGFDQRAGAGADIVAKIIEFYIPNSFRRNVAWVSPARRGKVIEFGSQIRTKVMCMQKGASILRSAVIGGLGLELTDPFTQLTAAHELQWD